MTMTLPQSEVAGLHRLWVERAQAGDTEAREELARHCQRQAYLLALQLTGNRDDALDLAQDAVIRFFGALGRFDCSRPLRPWLFRIVRNLYRDRLRRQRLRRTEPLEAVSPLAAAEGAGTPASPEALASRQELRRVVWEEVQKLPPMFREILVLRDYQDLEYSEIARILRVPRGTVMSRLHRARRRLAEAVRARLAPAGGDPGKDGAHA